MYTHFSDTQVNEAVNALDDAGELVVGATRRFHHHSCGDTRRRGYVTRKYGDDGAVVDLFYCHNCGGTGARRPPFVVVPTDGAMDDDRARPETHGWPEDAVPAKGSESSVPGTVAVWAATFRVSDTAMWSPSMGRIIMPINPPHSFQARRPPYGDPKSPKYLTVNDGGAPLRMIVRPIHDQEGDESYPPIIVWTEDWTSAHQFRYYPNVHGSPLFGLNVVAENVLWADRRVMEIDTGYMAPGREPVHIVWLDNDVPKAFEAAEYLQRLLGAIGRRVYVNTGTTEPKAMSPREIGNLVDQWRALA